MDMLIGIYTVDGFNSREEDMTVVLEQVSAYMNTNPATDFKDVHVDVKKIFQTDKIGAIYTKYLMTIFDKGSQNKERIEEIVDTVLSVCSTRLNNTSLSIEGTDMDTEEYVGVLVLECQMIGLMECLDPEDIDVESTDILAALECLDIPYTVPDMQDPVTDCIFVYAESI